jgi:hypothetical protein
MVTNYEGEPIELYIDELWFKFHNLKIDRHCDEEGEITSTEYTADLENVAVYRLNRFEQLEDYMRKHAPKELSAFYDILRGSHTKSDT